MSGESRSQDALRFDLAAEEITVRIRWFGVVVGFGLVNLIEPELLPSGSVRNVVLLNAILGFGAVYAALDSVWSFRGRVFLSKWPLAVSLMEAVFIGFLCYFDVGQESPFRFYYFLSVVVCAMRYSPTVTYVTLAFHTVSYSTLLLPLPTSTLLPLIITVVSMGWVTWASTRMASLVRRAREQLVQANEKLEHRIAERTQELRESQAMLVQNERQAAFGLLAAGIAHEVGNPLAAISGLVQILRRNSDDDDTQERCKLIGDQLRRIQGTLRELVDFSTPATQQETLCSLQEIVEEALSIAKYYKRRKGKRIVTRYAEGMPPMRVVRDQLVQVSLNLILNAMDATSEGGTIEITTCLQDGWVRCDFRDTGCGIDEENRARIFEPYFTTKDTGTGLGLFVCRQILERNRSGRIELTETGEQGTTFSVLVTSDEIRGHADVAAPEESTEHSLSVAEAFLADDSVATAVE